MIRLKRAYEPMAPEDGHRVLVDRLWPRGVRKEQAHIDEWLKDIAPSDSLRKWFGHDPERWAEFQRRYLHELDAAAVRPLVDGLVRRARTETITFIYSAHDELHNDAVVLKKKVEQRLARSPRSARRVDGERAPGRRTQSTRRSGDALRASAGGSRDPQVGRRRRP